MNIIETLPAIVEAPIIVVLAAAVLVLAWALVRMVASLLRAPTAIFDAMHEAGETTREALIRAVGELRRVNVELEAKLRAERARVERAQVDIFSLKERLLIAEQGRRQAAAEREACREVVAELETKVEQLSEHLRDPGDRAA